MEIPVEVRQILIAEFQSNPSCIGNRRPYSWVLGVAIAGVVVPAERMERSRLMPSEAQLFGGVSIETADV